MYFKSIWVFIFGMTIFGMGMSGVQQLRVAATDMYPHFHRAQALGYLALGSLVGLVFSPIIISGSEKFALANDLNALALPWFLLPVMIISGMAMVFFVHPDPKEIGMNLGRYYPGYTPPAPGIGAKDGNFSAASLMRNVPTRMAIISNSAAQGNMSIVMVLTSLVLASSATPPFLPVPRIDGHLVADGGMVDNAPAFAAELDPAVRQTLILLTRWYRPERVGFRGRRWYLAPSRRVEISRWEYTRPDLVADTLAMGREEANRWDSRFDAWLA